MYMKRDIWKYMKIMYMENIKHYTNEGDYYDYNHLKYLE